MHWHSVTAFLARLRNQVSQFGPVYVAYLALRRCTRVGIFEFRHAYINAVELNPERPVPPDDPSFREVSQNEVKLLTALKQDEVESLNRFEQGERAWIIERDGQAVALQWTGNTSRKVSDWMVIEGYRDDIWGLGMLVDPDHRGQGLGPRLYAHVTCHLVKAGHSRFLGAVDTLNRSSRRSTSKAGFQRVGSLDYLRLFRFTLVRYGSHWRLGYWHRNKKLRLSVSAPGEPPNLNLLDSP